MLFLDILFFIRYCSSMALNTAITMKKNHRIIEALQNPNGSATMPPKVEPTNSPA